MLLLNGLVAAVAISLFGDTAAASGSCGQNACGKAVMSMHRAKESCSARLRHTVTVRPTSTTVVSVTVQRTLTSDVTLTKVKPQTDRQTDTLVETSTEVRTITAIETVARTATVVETLTSTAPTVTVTVTQGAQPPVKRRSNRRGVPGCIKKACNMAGYVEACRCIGVNPTTVTRTEPAVTTTVRRTVTKDPALKTNTRAVTRTSITTVLTTVTHTTSITNSDTITNTFTTTDNTATLSETVVVVPTATVTAVNPPVCRGTGFNLGFSPASPWGDTGLGFVNNAGRGLYIETFQNSQKWAIGLNGLTRYSPNDNTMIGLISDSHPDYLQFAAESNQYNIHYPGQQRVPINCNLGPAPDYELRCLVPGKNGDQPLPVSICRFRAAWLLFLHYPGASVPQGATCQDITVKAYCPAS